MAPGEPLLALNDFPKPTDDQWRKLVDKVLAGADFDKKLVARTADGIALKPLYTRADWPSSGDPSGFPGGAPYTRGSTVLGSAGGWDIRQRHEGAPETLNKTILEDLQRGVSSVVLKTGALQCAADMMRTLQDVLLDIAPVVLESESATLPPAVLLLRVLKAQNTFAGNFGLDDLGGFAATGTLAADLETTLARMADMAGYIAKHFPKARAFNVRGTIYHAAGASEAQELACAVATGLGYLRAMTAAGQGIDAACGQIAFTLAVDADLFLSVAKLRAFRKLWARVTEVCGATERTAPVTACTASRMMTRRDPWVNVLRTTVACFAAGAGGADAVTVLPFDAALGSASALARRVARNIHIVLQEEAGLGRVADPAGGAWMFERLTDDLAEKAWRFFQEIERAGGQGQALASGFIADKVAAVQAERTKNMARRKDAITGVSEFPNINEPAAAIARAAPAPAPKSNGATPSLPAPGVGALTEVLVASAADAAAIAAALTGASVSVSALKPLRLAEGFEHLRYKSDVLLAQRGKRPKVFLATLGNLADFTARASFAKNFFEAGGIEAIAGAGGVTSSDMARDFIQSGARYACICGTDAVYGESAAPAAKALKDAGAVVYLAGRPGDLEAGLRAAGIEEFIYMGADVQAVLERAYTRLDAA